MKYRSRSSKYIILAVVLVVFVLAIPILFNLNGNHGNEQSDYYVSKYSPNSLAYFNCKLEGYQAGNRCAICEDLFRETFKNKIELNLKDDQAVIDYVKNQNVECVNKVQGGN